MTINAFSACVFTPLLPHCARDPVYRNARAKRSIRVAATGSRRHFVARMQMSSTPLSAMGTQFARYRQRLR